MSSIVSLFENTTVDPVTACFAKADRDFINDRYKSFRDVLTDLNERKAQFIELDKAHPNKYYKWNGPDKRYINQNYQDKSIDEYERYRFSFLYPIELITKLKEKLRSGFISELTQYFKSTYHINISLRSAFEDKLKDNFTITQLHNLLIDELELDGETLNERSIKTALTVFEFTTSDRLSIKGNRLSIDKVAYEEYTSKFSTIFSLYLAGDIHSPSGNFIRIGEGIKSWPDDDSKIIEVKTYKNRKMDILFKTKESMDEFISLTRLAVFP